jgi:hypothetical protein
VPPSDLVDQSASLCECHLAFLEDREAVSRVKLLIIHVDRDRFLGAIMVSPGGKGVRFFRANFDFS